MYAHFVITLSNFTVYAPNRKSIYIFLEYCLDNVANFTKHFWKGFKRIYNFSTIVIIIITHSENKHVTIMYNKAASIPVKIYGKTAAFYIGMIIVKIYMSYPCYILIKDNFIVFILITLALGLTFPANLSAIQKIVCNQNELSIWTVCSLFYILLLSSFVGIVSFITCCELLWPVRFLLFCVFSCIAFGLRCFSFVKFSHSCCFNWENLGGKL